MKIRDKKGRFVKTQTLSKEEYKKQYHYDYYRENKERLLKYGKKWLKENKDKVKQYKKTDKTNNKQHYQIRKKTYNKYGKLPKGMEYHHTTEPYHEDIWIGMIPEEHFKTR